VIYTATDCAWQIEIYNSSNGTAYSVYVDDVLGSDSLRILIRIELSGSLTTQRTRTISIPINGASFLFERVAERAPCPRSRQPRRLQQHGEHGDGRLGWGASREHRDPTARRPRRASQHRRHRS
jgi:hypothetical protein